MVKLTVLWGVKIPKNAEVVKTIVINGWACWLKRFYSTHLKLNRLYKDSLKEDLQKADLVISHAGKVP